jgi:predicted RNase H-like HicB family nuclease
MKTNELTNKPKADVIAVDIQTPKSDHVHDFDAVLTPEDEGGYSVFALRYPGVVSQAETVEEAKQNIGDAFLAMLEATKKRGRKLEYSNTPWMDIAFNSLRVRVRVNG